MVDSLLSVSLTVCIEHQWLAQSMGSIMDTIFGAAVFGDMPILHLFVLSCLIADKRTKSSIRTIDSTNSATIFLIFQAKQAFLVMAPRRRFPTRVLFPETLRKRVRRVRRVRCPPPAAASAASAARRRVEVGVNRDECTNV